MKIRAHINLVIAGKWNISILKPDWFTREFTDLVHPKEKIPIKFSIDTGTIRFPLEEVTIQPTQNRLDLIAIVEDNDHYAKVEQFAEGIIRKLPHTPISAIGHNRAYDLTTEEMKYTKKSQLDEFELIYQARFPKAVVNSQSLHHAINLSDHVINITFTIARDHSYINFNFNYPVQNEEQALNSISQVRDNITTSKKIFKNLVGARNDHC